MAIRVLLKGNENAREYSSARKLSEMFRDRFHDCVGTIVVYCGAVLFGTRHREQDIVVAGHFEKPALCEVQYGLKRQIKIYNFVFVIDVKDHTSGWWRFDGPNLKIKRMDRGREIWIDALAENHKQSISVKKFIENNTGMERSPTVCHFLWLRNVSDATLQDEIAKHNIPRTHNVLATDTNCEQLFSLACLQNLPTGTSQILNFSCLYNPSKANPYEGIEECLNLYSRVSQNIGRITREKLEGISKELIAKQRYAEAIGSQLSVISGRAGTGKTIKLLRLAYDLAVNHNRRCLLLTYNHMLASDLKRLIALSGMPSDIDSYTVEVQTSKAFFRRWMIATDVMGEHEPNFYGPGVYESFIKNLRDYGNKGALTEKDISEIIAGDYSTFGYDHILVDESQDWLEHERDILYKIYGHQNLIIADGVDQMNRSQIRCPWNIYRAKQPPPERKSLRQKRNLVTFANAYARKVGVEWKVEPNDKMLEGNVIISTIGIDIDLYEREMRKCHDDGNRAYEMLFLMPPSEPYMQKVGTKRIPAFMQTLPEVKFWFYDSTQEGKEEYPTDPDQHRLINYESCRGLEGWTVVCLGFDTFVQNKLRSHVVQDKTLLEIDDPKTIARRNAYLWSIIPLTRPIDTLIITLDDPDSEVALILQDLAKEFSDFVEWVE